MSNLRQITLGNKMAIDADEGKLWQGYTPGSSISPPDQFAQTAQGQWHVKTWGFAKEG